MKRLGLRLTDAQHRQLTAAARTAGVSASAHLRRLIARDAASGGPDALVPAVASREEVLALLSAQAREGSVMATRALLATPELRPGAAEPTTAAVDIFDELASRRVQPQGA